MRHKRLTVPALISAAALGAASPAGATASLTCAADDRQLSFEFLGNMGSGPGASIQVIAGEIKLKALRGKFAATEFKIEPAHLAAQWNLGRELRIGLSPDDVAKVGIYLAVIAERTKSGGDLNRYRGSYIAKVSHAGGETELKGKLKDCSAG